MRILLTSFLFLFFANILICQNPIDKCSTDERHFILMQDSAYAAQYHKKKNKVKRYLKNHKNLAKADCDEILYLPVAVHFQDVTIDYACAVDMALSQVETLNEDYGGTNPDITKWEEGRLATWPQIQNGKSCVQFCLATLNHPDGVDIVEGDWAVTLNEYSDDMDDVSEWSGYINFFVRNMDGGALGYSPLGGNGNGDGVVCGITYFGSVNCGGNTLSAQYNLGRTITHELGHYLSLNHPFDTGNCTVDGDGIADTPLTDAATYGCYAIGEDIINCADPVLWPSYMEYCDDACLYMFSQEQIDNIDAYVNTSLGNLLNNATAKCEDAACILFEVTITSIDESCMGNDGRIFLEASGGTEPYIFSITNGQTTSTNGDFNNLERGEYAARVVDQQGCEFTQIVEIERETPSMEILNTENSFCGDNSGSLSVKVNYDADFQYKIQGLTSLLDTNFFSNLGRGTYTVVAQTAAGCTSSIEVEIGDESDLSFIVRSVQPVNCPLIDNGHIKVDLSGGVEPIQWQLNNGNRTDSGHYENLSPDTYVLFVEDSRGCQLEQEFKVGLSYLNIGDECPCEVYIPNAMTPDGDGLNDLLTVIPSCPISEYNLQIFSRWGELIYESKDLDTRWNGGLDGYYVEAGIYLYKITYRWGEVRNESIEVQTERGFVTVLR